MTIDVVTRQRIVASQGDRAQHFYVLLSGSASVFTTNESTNVTTHLATIGPVFPLLSFPLPCLFWVSDYASCWCRSCVPLNADRCLLLPLMRRASISASWA
jgi:hypothetical protein